MVDVGCWPGWAVNAQGEGRWDKWGSHLQLWEEEGRVLSCGGAGLHCGVGASGGLRGIPREPVGASGASEASPGSQLAACPGGFAVLHTCALANGASAAATLGHWLNTHQLAHRPAVFTGPRGHGVTSL